ncbi:DUF6261 family protein [Streptococcus dentiloxodontae]
MSDTIKKVPLAISRLSTLESSQCIAHTLDAFSKQKLDFSTDKRLQTLIDRLQTALPQYEKSIKQEKATPLTMTIKEADAIRDHDIQALFSIIKVYKNSRIEEKQAAYKALNKLFQGYKGIKTANYEKETALLKNLFEKLAQPNYMDYLKQLNATEFLENLKASQDQFYQIYLEADPNSEKVALPTATQIRKAIEADYQLLYNYLLTSHLVEQDDTSQKALLLFNDIRQRFSELIQRRNAKASANESKEDIAPSIEKVS